MHVESLDFRHMEPLHDRFKKLHCPIAEYSFPNLYLFRHAHKYEVVFEKEIFIKGLSYDGYTYLMPTVEIGNMESGYIKAMMNTVDFLFPIPETWLECFSHDDYHCTCKQGDMDHIYAVEQMNTYKGRNLHSKRNLLKQFISTYAHKALPLTNDRLNDALSVLNGWLDDQDRIWRRPITPRALRRSGDTMISSCAVEFIMLRTNLRDLLWVKS